MPDEKQANQESQFDKERLDCNKLLLSFYSAQLNNHGRMVIGFAALIFTVTQVASSVSDLYSPISGGQYWIIASAMFFSSLAFFYVLMRLLVYGVLASYAYHSQLDNFQTMNEQVERVANEKEKILWKVPVSWFTTGEKHNKRRRFYAIFIVCAPPSLLITFLLLVVLKLVPVDIFQLFSFL